METLLEYMLKLSISLVVLYLFYQFVLRRLTFYNWNRWYLVSYSLFSFFIPFIDISLVLDRNEWESAALIKWVPSIESYSPGTVTIIEPTGIISPGFILAVMAVLGMVIMLIRLLVQLYSFRKMIRKAELIPAEGMNIYQVNEAIIPFSFGNSIFINQGLHTEEELREIIRHEFVHVKQKHSVDIIFSEFLCLVNWYNPFAWLIRRAIRQNLEFIADNKVLENGLDRKQYQYLLLKVIGNNQFSIASKFNFSSLKKRIAMMNKMKSAGLHLVKFLFILPLLAVLLVAFRNSYQEQSISNPSSVKPLITKAIVFTDTVPSVKTVNSKGYLIDVKGVNGNCVVVVKNKDGKEIDKVDLNEWKENLEKFDEKYGEILPPPPTPPAVPIAAIAPIPPVDPVSPIEAIPPTTPTPPTRPIPGCCDNYPSVHTVAPGAVSVEGHGLGEGIGIAHSSGLGRICKEWEISNKIATMKLKDGKIEKYDLANPEQRAVFESKYGKVINAGEGVRMGTVAAMTGLNGQTVVAPMGVSPGYVTIVDDYGHTITGKEDVLVTITSNTTRQELDQFIVKMKEKGIELSFDEIEYNSKGKLVAISGRMKSADGQSNFVANDFEKLCLAMIKKGEQTYFKVSTKDREVI